MEKNIKVYVVGNSTSYARFIENCEITHEMSEADVVIFTGGADVDPNLYGERKLPCTYINEYRDEEEVQEYIKSLEFPNILRLGICRGHQFLAVMNGAKLVQDVSNHAGINHLIQLINGDVISTNSLHHQMVYPYNIEDSSSYELLGWSKNNMSSHYAGGGIHWKKEYVEPEIIYFPKTNCLGVQGHPEMLYKEHDLVKYVNYLIKTKLK